jgi:hypothetical protein
MIISHIYLKLFMYNMSQVNYIFQFIKSKYKILNSSIAM